MQPDNDLFAIVAAASAATLLAAAPAAAQAPAKKPNILVIWGDDIGVHNISAYNHGIMGYRTPNIDRIAKEGALFTDAYAQQSCTAGRASFILGQHPFRTGLLTIGMPGSPQGIPDWTPTIADLLEGARLRHRPVRQEPPRRPGQAPADGARLRRVLRQPLPPERRGRAGDLLLPEGSRVQEEVRPARRAAHLQADGKGGQTIEDTGPLTRKRMETIDEEIHAAEQNFVDRTRRRPRSPSSCGSTPPACTSGRT